MVTALASPAAPVDLVSAKEMDEPLKIEDC